MATQATRLTRAKPSVRAGLSLVEILVVLALVVALCALLAPVFFKAKRAADKVDCLSNLRQCVQAVKMYEGDHGVVPIDNPPEAWWEVLLLPYVRDARLFLCALDTGAGRQFRRAPHASSFLYNLNPSQIKLYGGLPPATRCPLFVCGSDHTMMTIIGRYDGSVEVAPARRYPAIHYEGAAWDGREPSE